MGTNFCPSCSVYDLVLFNGLGKAAENNPSVWAPFALCETPRLRLWLPTLVLTQPDLYSHVGSKPEDQRSFLSNK